MTAQPASQGGRPTDAQRAITRLLRERGIGQHALFLTQQEGTVLPNGLEAVSGFVLEPSGRVHGFWLAWNEQRQAPTLAPFYLVEDATTAFAEDAEYHAARRELRLP